ncbi:MAG TPA: ABC transporter permease [Bacteroidia bacterium]|nr:ABC transporter permease [Bacteroidia bacterium]
MFLRIFKESIISAAQALTTNKLRSFLSLLSITIGIFAIIFVFTILDSLENRLKNNIESLGEDVIFVQKWPMIFERDYPWWKYYQRPQPTYDELKTIMERCYGAQGGAYVFYNTVTLRHASSSIENIEMTAASQDYNLVKNLKIADGRYFSEMESTSGRPVAIIGSDIAEIFFPSKSAVGQSIKLNGYKLTVVGVFKKEGENILGSSSDKEILVPVNFAKNLFDLNNDNLNHMLMIRAKETVSNNQLVDELTGIIRSLHKLRPKEDEDFALNQISMLSNQFDKIFDMLGIIGWFIGGFSILVGGFGIANIMFVSVKERTNIIGIQKSLGAKNYFILTQFLSEAIFLCVIGGAIGLLSVFLIILAINKLAGMEFALTQGNIVLGLSVSVIIGVVSGVVPAYSASKLDPVEAIRSN